jgi:hypothetical protein
MPTNREDIAMPKEKKKKKKTEKSVEKRIKKIGKATVKGLPEPAPKRKTAKKKPISADDIALRAYFIAERRQAIGGHGDEAGDWIEAERQLREEAKKR